MTNQNENLDEVKKAWIAMGNSLGMRIPEYSIDNLNDKKTALDRLRNSYKRFFIAAAIFTFTSFLIFYRFSKIDGQDVIYIGIAYSAYFFTVFLMDFWMWKGIGTINPLTMSVSEVTRKSLFYRKRHLQFVAVLLPIAISIMCVTGYIFSYEKYFLVGIIAGAIVGFALGVTQLLRFLDDYRTLIK